jgi:hypothetical protein
MRCKPAPFFKSIESFGLSAILLNPRHEARSYNLLIPLNDILPVIYPGTSP